MKLKIISLPLIVFLFSLLALNSIEVNAQTYLPVGPQTDVPVSTVTNGGWVECYRDIYNNDVVIDSVLSDCPGSQLMLACRETDSSTLILLAQGMRSDVTFDTGIDNQDELHIANGVGWYFNADGLGEEGNAWGFVRAGDSVDKNNCDTDTSGANDERLCWHLQEDTGGYRCGVMQDLNEGDEGSENYERIVYMAEPVSAQVPTLSEWGLIAMASILGIVGFMVIRRRKVTA